MVRPHLVIKEINEVSTPISKFLEIKKIMRLFYKFTGICAWSKKEKIWWWPGWLSSLDMKLWCDATDGMSHDHLYGMGGVVDPRVPHRYNPIQVPMQIDPPPGYVDIDTIDKLIQKEREEALKREEYMRKNKNDWFKRRERKHKKEKQNWNADIWEHYIKLCNRAKKYLCRKFKVDGMYVLVFSLPLF
jgi:hypothetical protein